jgi:inositol-phosphate phosphatase / L-galactose 1-phosphate phosphatase
VSGMAAKAESVTAGWISFALAAGLSVISCCALQLFQTRTKQLQNDSSKHHVPTALLDSPLRKEIQVASELALRAGRAMYDFCNQKGTAAEALHDLEIETKGQAEDFCTKIDVANEHMITNELEKEFPSHNIIGEEATGTGGIPPLTDSPTWIIDPIDGTTNFASGLPLTCVSIGLCSQGRPVLGVVYAPMTDELYLAVQGYGAYRNGVPLTKQRCNKKRLLESVVCFEFGYARDTKAVDKMVGVVQRILYHGCRTMRSLGSGVLDLCYVATGRIDVVYAGVAGEGWKPWDYCAGYVIASETGCCMQSIIGQKADEWFDIYSDSLICAVNPSLLQEIREIILSS